MNQDEARRMAEEVELPEPDAYSRHASPGFDEKELYTEAKVREAIAAALVKYTQGKEPVVKIVPTMTGLFPVWFDAEWHEKLSKHGDSIEQSLYTYPIPSQQEERKPLTDEQIETIRQEGTASKCDKYPFYAGFRAAEAVLKEKHQMWKGATIEPCSHEACYLRGIVDSEAANNIRGQK